MHTVSCENSFCIYWKAEQCTLDSISLNDMGMCMEGISIRISEEELNVKRKETLEKLTIYRNLNNY